MKTAKKSFAYLVLILGALIMVLPFFWMIISSLKTAAEVNTTPPTFWPKELVFENYVYAFEKAPVPALFLQLAARDHRLRCLHHVHDHPRGLRLLPAEIPGA